MANNKLEITFPAANGGVNWAVLTGIEPRYDYDKDKKSEKTLIGFKVHFALQSNRFKNLVVKVDGTSNPLGDLTDEQIQEACSSMKLIAAKPVGCKVMLYSIGGEMVMSATATGIELVNASGK